MCVGTCVCMFVQVRMYIDICVSEWVCMCMEGGGQTLKMGFVLQKLSTLSFGQVLLLGFGAHTLGLA